MDPEKMLRSALGLAIAGLAGMLLAPIVLPPVARVARPVVKGAVKAGLIMVARGRETLTEFVEMAEDMVAEVRAELAAEGAAQAEAGAPATGPATEATE
jgi:hypothetical protein